VSDVTGPELSALVADICSVLGAPHLASEIQSGVDRTYGAAITRPLRALTEREAFVMLRVWRDGYKAAGTPTCPHGGDVSCACPEGSVPDLDNEELVSIWLAKLQRSAR
jgi:hypothetical protein